MGAKLNRLKRRYEMRMKILNEVVLRLRARNAEIEKLKRELEYRNEMYRKLSEKLPGIETEVNKDEVRLKLTAQIQIDEFALRHMDDDLVISMAVDLARKIMKSKDHMLSGPGRSKGVRYLPRSSASRDRFTNDWSKLDHVPAFESSMQDPGQRMPTVVISKNGRCPDCGKAGELKGHTDCQYPSDDVH